MSGPAGKIAAVAEYAVHSGPTARVSLWPFQAAYLEIFSYCSGNLHKLSVELPAHSA